MPGLDVEDFHESDSSDNDENHSKLLSSVSQLDSTQRVKPAQRREIASEVSEYNLSQGVSNGANLIDAQELVRALGKKSEHGLITKKFRNVTKNSRTLPKPLEKPQQEKLKRAVGFENVKKQLGKWDAIVTRNALNDHISFPLNDNTMKMQKSSDFLKQFKSTTPLEEEIGKLLKEEKKTDEEEEEDMTTEFPLTLEEMLEKRKEMAQLRAKLSYKQSKAQRQSKIKSKKYHRLLKHEKIKQQLKEFEVLQKTDPEAALKKLEELDRTRARERASLRHRNTGQWAKNLTVRAKYDVETRKVLAEQLKVSRELTQKVSQNDSSDDEEVPPPVEFTPTFPVTTSDNPWTLNVSKEVQDFVSGYKKFWEERNKEAEKKVPEDVSRVGNGEEVTESPIEESVEEKVENAVENVVEKSVEESSGGAVSNVLKNTVEKAIDKSVDKTKAVKKTMNKSVKKIKEKQTDKSVAKTVKKLTDNSVDNSTSDLKKARKQLKGSKKISKAETCVTIHPASGVWIVEPIAEQPPPEKPIPAQRKRKADDLENLFDELNEKLLTKAKKKVVRIKRQLNKVKVCEEERKKESEEVDLSLKPRGEVQRPDMDVGLLEGGVESFETVDRPLVPDETKTSSTAEIDPKNFIQIKPKRLRTYLPENVTGDEDGLDDDEEQQKLMEEAFAGDDVTAEFKKMKKEEEKSQVVIETSLPGWGKWGGTGIVGKPKRKKRMLVLKAPPRKDKKKNDTIINENENPNLKNHMVKEVPHPFKSVTAFEANIRAPIGRQWVPETAHQKLIEKPVVTKLGAIIEPMSENEIVRSKKAPRSPYQGKKKNRNK